MFYIEPTPLSKWIWVGIWGVAILLALIPFAIGVHRVVTKKQIRWLYLAVLPIAILLVAGGLSVSSAYMNYINSAKYAKEKKELELEYNPKQIRTIDIYNIEGKIIYTYTGNFNFNRKGNGLNLVDNETGKKISVAIGDNTTVIVTDK